MLYTNMRNFNLPKPVMEKYVGSSVYIEKALNALGKIVNDINSKSYLDMQVSSYNNTKENKIICDMFEKEFGFNSMTLIWDNSTIPNAYTIPGGIILNSSPGMSHITYADQKRYHDSRHSYDCYVCIIMDIVRSLKLTPRETMGLLLHEIGHNFDNLWTTQLYYGIQAGFMFIVVPDIIRFLVRNIHMMIDAMKQKLPELFLAIDAIKNLPYHLSVVSIPSIDYLAKFTNPIEIIHLIVGTRSEYYSDSFAANYGFGPDLASAFSKAADKGKIGSGAQRIIYNIPTMRTFCDILNAPFISFIHLIDPHPDDANRVLAMRKTLENDLNDPHTPKKLKPEIQKQIKLMDNIIEADIQNNYETGLVATALRKYIIYNSPVKDFYHR